LWLNELTERVRGLASHQDVGPRQVGG